MTTVTSREIIDKHANKGGKVVPKIRFFSLKREPYQNGLLRSASKKMLIRRNIAFLFMKVKNKMKINNKAYSGFLCIILEIQKRDCDVR